VGTLLLQDGRRHPLGPLQQDAAIATTDIQDNVMGSQWQMTYQVIHGGGWSAPQFLARGQHDRTI
jgi:hypothetical protein